MTLVFDRVTRVLGDEVGEGVKTSGKAARKRSYRPQMARNILVAPQDLGKRVCTGRPTLHVRGSPPHSGPGLRLRSWWDMGCQGRGWVS